MDKPGTSCPVCTLYLREGITLQAHLETHPKEQVIEALLKATKDVSKTPQPVSATAPYVPPQTYGAPGTAYVNTVPQFVNQPTQMTTAVTYQHFMTSNGSSAVMPQYVQVPTIVNPNNNYPLIANQSINYVPNQSSAYAQTIYNPLYNPYIPQPWPLPQPVYASGYPVAANSHAQSSSQTLPTVNNQSTIPKPNAPFRKCTIATNTTSLAEMDLSDSKSDASTSEPSSPPSTAIRKIKHKQRPRTKAKRRSKTATYRLIAPKESNVINESAEASVHPVESSRPGSSKTSVITTAKSNKSKPPSSSSSTSSSTSSSGLVSPPPLTLINRSRSSSLSFPQTPPPPPLTPAPNCAQVRKHEDVDIFIKSEQSDVAQSTPVIMEMAIAKVSEYLKKHPDITTANSVIVESNNVSQRNLEVENSHHEYDKETFNAVQTLLNSVVINKSDEIDQADPLLIEEEHELMKEVEGQTSEDQDPEEEEEPEEDEAEEDDVEDQEEEVPAEEFDENAASSLEIGDEKKVSLVFDIGYQDIPKEISSANIERNCDGSDIFIQQENIPFNDVQNSKSATLVSKEPYQNMAESEGPTQTAEYYNDEYYSSVGYPPEASEPPKYTDLQPVKYADPHVLQDMGLPDPRSFNNYMEVDGIRIFFNNNPPSSVPLEPIIKFTSNDSKTDGRSYLKAENEMSPLVESVIQLVSANSEPRNFNMRESYPASASHSNDGHLDLPDLSPLTLNIQADESMPARGELSEQESLGADNSNWGLFHNENRPEDWKHDLDINPVREAAVEVEKKTKKSFKCSLCNEIFSCPKERRVHKNTAHLDHIKSIVRKMKNFQCVQCHEVFASIRERRAHAMERHSSVKTNEIKQECDVKNEEETATNIKNEPNVKCEETPAPNFVSKTCSKCDLIFNSLKKLREHLREIHGIIRFKCDTCGIFFDDESDYNTHLMIHPLVCNQCGKTFHRKPNLSLHMKRHLNIKPYECSLCPKSFITRQKLEEHMNGHSGIKPIKCTLCDKTFSRHSNLIQHRNMHHLKVKKKIKDYVCRCGEVFHSLRKLEWHKEVHEAKPKTCPYCTQKFIHSASVTRHIRRAHLPDYLPGDNREYENVQCPICEKVYLRSSLMVHMRVHNGEKPFVCKICNKRFSTKWNLELHNWTHQSRSNMPYKCSICKSAFFRESDYIAHSNSHKNFKPFTCNICGQKFIRKYNCLRHQEEHKKAKRFVCTVNGCEKSFHRSYYLKDHMKVHTGVRPHTCHICGKASSTKSNHNKHVRIHDTREPVNTEN